MIWCAIFSFPKLKNISIQSQSPFRDQNFVKASQRGCPVFSPTDKSSNDSSDDFKAKAKNFR